MKQKFLCIVVMLAAVTSVLVGCGQQSTNANLENEVKLVREENEKLKAQLSGMGEVSSKTGEVRPQASKGSSNSDMLHDKEPYYWTLDLQEAKYHFLFSEKDIEGVLRFRNFVESLAQYHHGEPVYEFNPVILAIYSYPGFLEELFAKRPDLFTHGHYTMGDYGISPIVYTLRNCYLSKLKFFFEHDIPDLDKQPYGSRQAYWLGGNLITDARAQDMEEYLIGKGYEAEKSAIDYYYYLTKDGVNVFDAPGYENQVIDRLSKDTKIEATAVTMYKRNGVQWIKIKYSSGQEGWITQDLGLGFDSGI